MLYLACALLVGLIAVWIIPRRETDRPPQRLRPSAPRAATQVAARAISSFLSATPVALPLGRQWPISIRELAYHHRPKQGGRPFVVDETHLSHHQFIAGTTGSGKSRYAELQCRMLVDALRGFCFIDADGDTVENLAAYCSKKAKEEGSEAILRQVIYIELSFATLFGFDPFKVPDFSHVAPELRENAYQAFLHTRIDHFSLQVQSAQGASDFVGMARLQRVLRTVLYGIGTAVDRNGNHLPLSEVFTLLDCDHPRHNEVYACVESHLPEYIRTEFERWRGCRREERLKETESTLNRLRSLLSPIVMAIFSQPARSLNFREIIDNRMILLVNLRQTDFLSVDQQRVVGSMFIHEVWTACKVKEREARTMVPYYVYLDEAHLFMETASNDLLQILFRGRKQKVSLTLIGQYLGQFRNERVNMIPAILNLCRTIACFLHADPDDLDIWKKYFGYPNLDFTELYQVTDRPDEPTFLKIVEKSRSKNSITSWQAGLSISNTSGTSQSATKAEGNVSGTANATGHQTSESLSGGSGKGRTIQKDNLGRRLGIVDNENTSGGKTTANADSATETTSQSHSIMNSLTDATSTSTALSQSGGTGGSEGSSISETEKTMLIPQTYEFWAPTGKLRHAIADQFEFYAKVIRTLRNRQAMVQLFNETNTFRMDVGECPDVFPDPIEMAKQVESFKEKVFALHAIYFTPDLSPQAQGDVFRNWLQDVRGVPVARQPGNDPEIFEENPLDG